MWSKILLGQKDYLPRQDCGLVDFIFIFKSYQLLQPNFWAEQPIGNVKRLSGRSQETAEHLINLGENSQTQKLL